MSWRFWEKEAAPPPPAVDPKYICGFCGKAHSAVKWMVAGPAIAICDECVPLCQGLVDQARPTLPAPDTAKGLAGRLLARVPGQAAAAFALEHLLQAHLRGPDAPPAALLIGPRGSGKTALLDALGDLSGVPAQRFEAGRLTAAGYVGDDIENYLGALHGKAPQLAPRGLLLLDNLQHLMARERPRGVTLDVRGTRAQRQLTRLLDRLPLKAALGGRHPGQVLPTLPTRGLMVVMAVTLDPVPTDRRALLAALVDLGLEPALLRRIPVRLAMPRRDAATLSAVARLLGRDLPAGAPFDPDALGATAAAHPHGAWLIRQAVTRAALSR